MGLIPEDIIRQVIDRSDIVDVVSQYLPLKKAGRNFKASSPFKSEKTPSFVVSPDKQIFHCFSTGNGGNVITFVMKMERLEFPEAVRFLAKQVNIEIPEFQSPGDAKVDNERQLIFQVNGLAVDFFHEKLLSSKEDSACFARDYLKKRNINFETVKEFKLGYAPDSWDSLLTELKKQGVSFSLMEKAGLIISKEKQEGYYDRFRNRIIFPIFDTQGKPRAFGARALEEGSSAKYINSPETSVYTKGNYLYGFHLSKKHISEDDSMLITEGYMDCIMPYQANVVNVVASLGTALTKEQIRLLSRYTKNIVMLFDSDEAGQKAVLRSIDLLLEESMNVKVITLDDGEDPDSCIQNQGVEVFKEKIKTAGSFFDFKLKLLKKQFSGDSIEERSKIAKEMLRTISLIDDAIVNSEYVKKLAHQLRINEEALEETQKGLSKKTFKKVTEPVYEEKPQDFGETKSVEKNIIKILLEDDAFVSATKEEVLPDDFHDLRARQVIEKIYELFGDGRKVDSVNLINSFEDVSIQRFISEVMADERHILGDKEKMHSDCVGRIKNDRLKKIRKELMHKIREAEASGDDSKLNQLKVEFNQLIKG